MTGRGKPPQSVVVRYEGGGEEDVTFEALAGLMAAADAIAAACGGTNPDHTTPHLTPRRPVVPVQMGAQIKMPKTDNCLIRQRHHHTPSKKGHLPVGVRSGYLMSFDPVTELFDVSQLLRFGGPNNSSHSPRDYKSYPCTCGYDL